MAPTQIQGRLMEKTKCERDQSQQASFVMYKSYRSLSVISNGTPISRRSNLLIQNEDINNLIKRRQPEVLDFENADDALSTDVHLIKRPITQQKSRNSVLPKVGNLGLDDLGKINTFEDSNIMTLHRRSVSPHQIAPKVVFKTDKITIFKNPSRTMLA